MGMEAEAISGVFGPLGRMACGMIIEEWEEGEEGEEKEGEGGEEEADEEATRKSGDSVLCRGRSDSVCERDEREAGVTERRGEVAAPTRDIAGLGQLCCWFECGDVGVDREHQ